MQLIAELPTGVSLSREATPSGRLLTLVIHHTGGAKTEPKIYLSKDQAETIIALMKSEIEKEERRAAKEKI